MSTGLIRYDAARKALAAAKAVDEVLDLRAKSDALRIYAVQAKDREMERDAAEIRIRAERRLGEMLVDEKISGRLREGQAAVFAAENCSTGEQLSGRTRLADIGVDRKLSMRAQNLARLEPAKFEFMIGEWRERNSAETDRVTVSLLKREERRDASDAFAARTSGGCCVDDLHGLAASGTRYGVILADPPWHFETYSELGGERSAGRHYATDTGGDMFSLPVEVLAAPDCALLLWATWPNLAQALALIEAWGFTYKTLGFDWMKLNRSGEGLFMGAGYFSRSNSEPCLLATRGAPKRIDAGVLSAVLAPVGEHSVKPDCVQERIERLFAGPYLELYARRVRPGWTAWGNEIGREEFSEAAA
jgi:N6-adenosine-specific RNA methylase IME4